MGSDFKRALAQLGRLPEKTIKHWKQLLLVSRRMHKARKEKRGRRFGVSRYREAAASGATIEWRAACSFITLRLP